MASMDTPRALVTRAGLGIASLLLGAFLVLGFRTPDEPVDTGSATTGSNTNGSNTTGSNTTGSGTGGTRPTATARAGSGSTSGASGTKTVTGTLISTRYGPVQVEVTVVNGKITSITAVELPSGGRSGMISAYAAPILTNEALAAQSAQIDLVSGATYTSTGYERSLQAALDQVGA